LDRCELSLQVSTQHSFLLKANPSTDTEPAGTFTHKFSQRRIRDDPGDTNAFGLKLRHIIESAVLTSRNQAIAPCDQWCRARTSFSDVVQSSRSAWGSVPLGATRKSTLSV
jgi:hypothetical protein